MGNRMSNKNVSFDEVLRYLETLPYDKFKELVGHYAEHSKNDFEYELDNMVMLNFQARLEKLKQEIKCPKCGEAQIVKNGKRANGIQEYKCKECSAKFTLFSGTILEKTKYHWDLWVKVLEMTLNQFSIHGMIKVLEEEYHCKGINYKTIWNWRMKLISALTALPSPVLTGVIQIADITVKDSQKGNRNTPKLVGEYTSDEVMIISAIDNHGFLFSKVIPETGKEVCIREIIKHIHAPAYVCSYPSPIYEPYCKYYSIPHYIKPPVSSEVPHTDEDLESLYEKGLLGEITNRGTVSYEQFSQIMDRYHLGVGDVEAVNEGLKQFINHKLTNVNTRYLQEYISLYVFKHNWQATYGYRAFSIEDAEKIFVEFFR